jgi:antitoxin component YwqK of YwqJK toxin-antitoxin module
MKKCLVVLWVVLAFNVTTVIAKEIRQGETFIIDGVSYVTRTSKPVDGVVVKYYTLNRLLALRIHYKSGKKDGLEESFYRNGRLHFRVNYKDGKEDGLTEYFHTNGQLKSRASYKDGKEEGLTERFDKSGQKI